MGINGISVWGVVLTVILLVAALAVFWVSDRKMLVRSLRALSAMTIQLVLVAAYVWGLFMLDNWLVNILWLILMAGIVAYIYTRRVRLSFRRFWPSPWRSPEDWTAAWSPCSPKSMRDQ